MNDRDPLLPPTDAERAALIDAYLKSKPKRDLIERRRREHARLNSDEAIRQRNDFDVFNP
jgi:hypothetical protein